jgi:Meiotically Up-regulated Gene 113 (MUG113) protein
MLDESEVIRQGIEVFKVSLARFEAFRRQVASLNFIDEWLPSCHHINDIWFHVVTYMHLYAEHQSTGVIIPDPEKFDISNQGHLEGLQVAHWLYMQLDAISRQLMFCSNGEPDFGILGSKAIHRKWYYDETLALKELAIYPCLPERVLIQIDKAIEGYGRAYEEMARAEIEAMRASKRYGYVYLIQSPTGSYKIGRARNPEDRMKTFNVKLPFEVDYVHLIETSDMYGLERAFHKRYAQKRVNGEWFMLDPEDVQYICQFRQVHP